jgi:hypothetical protein
MPNRAPLILRYKLRRLDQRRRSLPHVAYPHITMADVNQEHTVYLVEADDEDELAGGLASHHQALFEY